MLVITAPIQGAYDQRPPPPATALEWGQLVQGLTEPQEGPTPNKEDCPAWTPAEFRPNSPNRRDQNVIQVHAAVVDLDDLPPEQTAAVLAALDHYDHIVYSTWSHALNQTNGNQHLARLRAVIRLTRPVTREEWPPFWRGYTTLLGVPVDDKCKNPGRIYFGPYLPPGIPRRAPYFVSWHSPGPPLDVDRLLGIMQTAPVPVRPTTKTHVTREALERLAKTWRRASNPPARQLLGDALLSVTKGEPFAPAGARDDTLFKLCRDLARDIPTLDPNQVAQLFTTSLSSMGSDAPDVSTVADKLERALDNVAAEEQEEANAVLTDRKLRIREAFAHLDQSRETPYSADEIHAYAQQQQTTQLAFRKRWIVQCGPSFYTYVAGNYRGPKTPIDIRASLVRDLAPASTAGVEITAEGAPKGLERLLGDYGSVAESVILDMRAQFARYDPVNRTFYEAPCPLRPLVPNYDPEVAKWLELLVPPQHLRTLLSWLAQVPDVSQPLAALMLVGYPGSGKTLLANGLARLWPSGEPTSAQQAMGAFNEALARSPLVFADERIPTDEKGRGRTAELREMIATRSRPYRKKFHSDSTILGCIRLLIAANNDEVLQFQENLSTNDISAIAERFVYIPAGPQATEYLKQVDTTRFVLGDAIAQHVLWLQANGYAQREGRFGVRAVDQSFYRLLSTRTGIRSAVCQWLVSYLRNPRPYDARRDLLVRVYQGRLLVNTEGLANAWGLYIQNETSPRTSLLTSALTTITQSRAQVRHPKRGNVHYRVVDPSYLIQWAQETDFASEEELTRALQVETPTFAEAPKVGAGLN